MPSPRLSGLFAATALTAFSASWAGAADVIVVLAPKCALDPKTIDLRDKKNPLYRALTPKSVTFAEGDSVKDVKVAGETFVIELLATTVTPGTQTGTFEPEGGGPAVRITYKTAALRQPYKVWYAKGAGEKPVLLGDHVATGTGSELKYLGGGKNEISTLTPAEVARRGMVEVHNEAISEHVHEALADKIIAGRSGANTGRPLFPPTKVVAGKGETTAEVALHNRLPVRATGLVRWEVGPGRLRADVAILAAGGKPPLNPSQSVAFDLEPGEKKTVTVTIPPEYAGIANSSQFALSRLELKSKK